MILLRHFVQRLEVLRFLFKNIFINRGECSNEMKNEEGRHELGCKKLGFVAYRVKTSWKVIGGDPIMK